MNYLNFAILIKKIKLLIKNLKTNKYKINI